MLDAKNTMAATVSSEDEALYTQWRTHWDKPWPQPNRHIVEAAYHAGSLFAKKPMPAAVRNELFELLQPNIDWSQTDILWLVLNNTLPGVFTKDRTLYKRLYASGMTHRIALQFALMLDLTQHRINERGHWASLQRWEPGIPRKLTIREVPNATAELIRAWGGDFKAEQWVTLVEMERTLVPNAKERTLENYHNLANLNVIIDFALHDQPIRSAQRTVSLPDGLSL